MSSTVATGLSEEMEGGLVGRIDEVVSLTFRCNVLQSEEYFRNFFLKF